jgi:WD40 repeat protein
MVITTRGGQVIVVPARFDATDLRLFSEFSLRGVWFSRTEDGEFVFLGFRDRQTVLWDYSTSYDPIPIASEFTSDVPITSASISASRKWLAVSNATSTRLHKIGASQQHDRVIDGIDPQFSLDSHTIACITPQGMLITNVLTGEKLYQFACEDVKRISFSSSGNMLAASGQGGKLWLFDLRSGHLLTSTVAQTSEILSLDFSMDGDLLAGGAQDGSVKLWNVSPFREIRHLNICTDSIGVPAAVWALAFSPDRRTLAVGGKENRVHLISVNTGREVLAFQPLSYSATVALSFSHDGTRLTAFGGAGDMNRFQHVIWSTRGL